MSSSERKRRAGIGELGRGGTFGILNIRKKIV